MWVPMFFTLTKGVQLHSGSIFKGWCHSDFTSLNQHEKVFYSRSSLNVSVEGLLIEKSKVWDFLSSTFLIPTENNGVLCGR